MSKSIISILLSLLFLVFLIAPTVIIIIDDSADVSIFYVSTEEEEKGNEKNKEIETILSELTDTALYAALTNPENNSEYYIKRYSKLHLNIISPPPETFLL